MKVFSSLAIVLVVVLLAVGGLVYFKEQAAIKDIRQQIASAKAEEAVPSVNAATEAPALTPEKPIVPTPPPPVQVVAPPQQSQVINVYCCPEKPAPALPPAKPVAKATKKPKAVTKYRPAPSAPAANAPCLECSKYAWDPSDPRQPKPGTVSQRIY